MTISIRKDWAILVVLLVSIFLLGWLTGRFAYFGLSYFEIDNKIQIANWISSALVMVTSVVLAFIVSKYLDKEKLDGRAEKEIFVKRVDRVNIMLDELISLVKSGSVDYHVAVSSIKQINVSLTSVYSSISSDALKNFEHNSNDVKRVIDSFRDTLTNDGAPKRRASVKKNIITLDSSQRSLFLRDASELENILFKLRLSINRM